MNLPELTIGNLKPKFPIIQGGMAIKVSMSRLAAAVASEGGIGVIAGTAVSKNELYNEIKKAKENTDGIIGVNIMYAATGFTKLVKTAVKAGIDLIITGAGFSRNIYKTGKKHNVPIVPIVSSLKLARIAEKLGASAVVVEGGDAGGHLGTERTCRELIAEIKNKINIPLIAAGNIVTPKDLKEIFKIGVDGVQMGTRFLASKESDVHSNFKQLCVKASNEDVIKFISSPGFPGSAIKTKFSKLIADEKFPGINECANCLKRCNKTFCIKDALLAAREGDLENGIFFTGSGIGKIKEILSVKEIFNKIKQEFSS